MAKHNHRARGSFRIATLAAVLAIISFSRLPLEAQNTILTGRVKDASGEPVVGALIKARSADLGLTFMVVSQAQGRYSTPNLLPGKYTVQGFGGSYQSSLAGPVEVSSGQQRELDIALISPRKVNPPEKRMLEAEYANLLPEGDGKKLLVSRCSFCHGMQRIVPNRAYPSTARSREAWQNTVETMIGYMEDHQISLSRQEKDVMVDYLAKHFGPDTPPVSSAGGSLDPNRNLPRTLLQGAEAQYVAMEFDLQSGTRPHDVAVDSQGMAWISERTGMIGRFDPDSLAYTRIATPSGKFPRYGLNAIAVDPRGHIWTMDNGPNNRMVHYDPNSREFNTYAIPPPPNSGGSGINTIRFYPDGSVWGTGIVSSRIVRLDPVTQEVTEFPVPKGSHPYGMALGGDGMVWYAANYNNEVVRLDPVTGKLARYKVPTPGSDIRRMAADAEGNLWVGSHEVGKLLRVDYRTGKITEYPTPTEDSGPYSVDVDTNRHLIWFGEHFADKIGRFDPRTNRFAEFSLPSPNSDVRRIEIDRSHPNRVWWSGFRSDKIGYIEVMD